MIRIFLGLPGCLPKGTLIKSNGRELQIQNVESCDSINDNGETVLSDCIAIYSGKKAIYNINTENIILECSLDHKWLIYRNGVVREVQTKHLKLKTDYLLKYETRPVQRKKRFVEKPRYGKNKVPLSDGKPNSIINKQNNECYSTYNPIQIKDIRNTKANYRVNKVRQQKQYEQTQKSSSGQTQLIIQAWQKYRKIQKQKIISSNSKNKLQLGLSNLQNKQNSNGFMCASYRQEPFQQYTRESNDSVSIMPLKITSITLTNEKIDMYDLHVPYYNNFVLSSGIISHNSGKTLSCVREMVNNPQIKTLSNIETIGVKNNTLISNENFVKKTVIGYKKNGEANIKREFNREYWVELKNTNERLNITLDEMHTLFNSRKSMSKQNLIMGDFIALIRKLMAKKDASHGVFTMISQIDRKIDVVGADMATQIKYHIMTYYKMCRNCGIAWQENNEMPELLNRCPRCGFDKLKEFNHVVNVWHFDNMTSYQLWRFRGSKTYYKKTRIWDTQRYFNKYNTLQWDNLLSLD